MFAGLITFMFELKDIIAESELAFPIFGSLFVAFCTFVKILLFGHNGVSGLDG
jgi:hypothetical protein